MRIIEIEHDLDHFIISQDDGVISYSERGYGDEVEIPLKSLSSSSSKSDPSWCGNFDVP